MAVLNQFMKAGSEPTIVTTRRSDNVILTFNPVKTMRYVVLATMICLAAPTHAAHQALLDLFEILRDKGSLTQDEFELLVNAAKADEEKNERVKHEAREAINEQVAAVEEKAEEAAVVAEKQAKKLAWAERIKIKGDLRTRYQYQDEDRRVERSRGRLRYRLGVIAAPAEGLEVGAGLASGGSDQRSNNQSFDTTFTTKGINLDYAYMQYAFDSGVTAVAGKLKFKKYLWTPTDVMWDTDINPEGFSANYTVINPWGGMFANAGVWVLEENSATSDDPFMAYGQVGQTWSWGNYTGTLAGAVYGFSDINFVSDLSALEGTNTDSKLSSFNLAGELGTALGGGKLRLLGEYINNFETNTSTDNAWALGARYAWNKWKVKYIYADVEANSVPDFLSDSDRFDGLTGVRGHEFEIKYALMEQVTFGLDFYHVEDIATDIAQDLVQVDVNVKF